MAVFRKTPECPYCKESIAEGVYLDQSHIPMEQRIIGDTFQRWEYKEHNCEESDKVQQEIWDRVAKQLNELGL